MKDLAKKKNDHVSYYRMIQRMNTNYLLSAHINQLFGKEEKRSCQLLLDKPKSEYKLLTACSYKSSIWQRRKTIMSATIG